MEKIEFYSEKVMQNTWKNKNNCNNNNDSEVNHYCKEVDDCHCKMIPKEESKSEDAKGIAICDKEPAIEIPNKEDHSDGFVNKPNISPINSNRTSRNNSTDNLSYCSDNYYGDELLLLQNAISDDELYLNSDDCIYAYRGGDDFEIPLERREDNVDDETDFLEMDFDPDPSSEIEPQIQSPAINVQFLNADDDNRQQYFVSPMGKISDDRIFPLPSNKLNISSSNLEQMPKPPIIQIIPENASKPILTGARPKQVSDKPFCSSNRFKKINYTDSKQKEHLSDKIVGCSLDEVASSIFVCNLNDQDETCLDCLESEFLSTTIGKPIDSSYCPRCKLNRSRLLYKNSNNRSSITNINDLSQMHRPSSNFDVNEILMPSVDLTKVYHENFDKTQIFNEIEKKVSKFSSKNVTENILVLALDKLNISYSANIIKSYFNKSQPEFLNIAEFIVYESKKNCDYKDIIKLIHSASKEELNIRFNTDKQLVDSEDIEVRTHDILKIWAKNKNLEAVKKLKYKFTQMNVLGKIINIIRQAQQRNEKPLPDYILVPQYYKSGFISIERKKS